MQTQKWVNLGLLGGGFVFFLFLQKLLEFGWEVARLPLPEEWPIRPDALIGFGVCVAVILGVRRQEKANAFLNEVAGELAKVSWPTRKESVLSTGVVIGMVAVSSLLLFVFDLLWGTIARGVLSF